MGSFFHGLTALGNWPSLAYLFGGALLGMLVGVIPGLSTVVILSIILVFTYHIDLVGTLCLFLGAQCGSFYSASVSAILLNTPAHPEALPICFDGYPMARNGQPGRALGLSACSTCIGGFIGCGVLVGFLQLINDLPDVFHPPEYLALVTLAMLMVGTVGTDSVAKAVAGAGAGLMLSSIGPSMITGTFRYTFGAVGLFGGVSLVALALGVFAIPQMVMIFGTGSTTARQDMTGKEIAPSEAVEISHGYTKQLLGGVLETFRHWTLLLQSGLIGGLTGIVPGIGGFTGNFLSYGIAKQTSRKRELYGTGIPDGIIAPEGSSIAKEAGHIIPIIGLGIPGGVAGALFIGALSIKNIRTGYGFTAANPNVSYEIVWIIALSGLIGTIAGVLIGPQLARVTKVPGPLLAPFILALSVIGPFLTDVEFFSVMELLVFGIVGLALRRLRYPLGSFILGLVLGPTFETNIYLTHTIYPGLSFVGKRPLADAIFLIAIAVLIAKAIEIHRTSRKSATELVEDIAQTDNPLEHIEALQERHRRLAPYPLLAPIMSLSLLAVSLCFIVYGATSFPATAATLPIISGSLVALPTLLMLPRDISRYAMYRKSQAWRRRLSGGIESNPLAEADPLGKAEGFQGAGGLLPPKEGPHGVDYRHELATIRDRSWGRHGQYRRELIAFGWLCVLIGASWLFGFLWGITIFMAAYGMISTKRHFRNTTQQLIFTVLSATVMWVITYEMFHLTHIMFTPKVSF